MEVGGYTILRFLSSLSEFYFSAPGGSVIPSGFTQRVL